MKKEARGAAAVEFAKGEAEDGSGNPEDCIAVVSTGGSDRGKECCYNAVWSKKSGESSVVPEHLRGIARIQPSVIKRTYNVTLETPDVALSNSVYAFFSLFPGFYCKRDFFLL